MRGLLSDNEAWPAPQKASTSAADRDDATRGWQRYRWIPGLDQYQDLIVIFDYATSEVYDVQLVDEESTATVMAALKRVVETRGLFCSLYSDRGSHMAWTPKAGGPVDRQKPTQIARALDELGIELLNIA
jgi:hypothetical protein